MTTLCHQSLQVFINVVWTLNLLQIVIRDCIHVLHEMLSTGRSFDYVINDLTEFPVEKSLKGLIVNCGIMPGWGKMYDYAVLRHGLVLVSIVQVLDMISKQRAKSLSCP